MLAVPELLGSPEQSENDARPPEFGTVLLVLVTAEIVSGDATWVKLQRMVGQTPVALLITVIVAMRALGQGRSASDMETKMDRAAGAGPCHHPSHRRRWHVRWGSSGIGQALARSLATVGMPKGCGMGGDGLPERLSTLAGASEGFGLVGVTELHAADLGIRVVDGDLRGGRQRHVVVERGTAPGP